MGPLLWLLGPPFFTLGPLYPLALALMGSKHAVKYIYLKNYSIPILVHSIVCGHALKSRLPLAMRMFGNGCQCHILYCATDELMAMAI